MNDAPNGQNNKVLARINDAMSNKRSEKTAAAGETMYAFQHTSIERFKVGPFQFINNICRVPESQVDAFIALWEGLQASDKNQIIQLKEEINSRSLREFKAVRGALGTADIKDKATPDPAPKATESPALTDAALASTPGGGLKLQSFSKAT